MNDWSIPDPRFISWRFEIESNDEQSAVVWLKVISIPTSEGGLHRVSIVDYRNENGPAMHCNAAGLLLVSQCCRVSDWIALKRQHPRWLSSGIDWFNSCSTQWNLRPMQLWVNIHTVSDPGSSQTFRSFVAGHVNCLLWLMAWSVLDCIGLAKCWITGGVRFHRRWAETFEGGYRIRLARAIVESRAHTVSRRL